MNNDPTSTIPPYRRGTPGWVAALIIFTATALIVAGAVIINGRRQKQKAFNAETARVGAETREQMQSELEKKGSISPETALKGIEKLRDQVAKGGTDPSRLIAEFASDLAAVMTPYVEIAKRVKTENPFDPSSIKQRGDLAQRRVLGEQMLKQNAALLAFIEGAESRFRTKLEQAGLSQSSIDQGMKAFAQGFTSNLASSRRMRQLDAVVAAGLIEQSTLLDTEWGRWHIEKSAIVFNSTASLAKYNVIHMRLKSAVEEETKTQQQLLSKAR